MTWDDARGAFAWAERPAEARLAALAAARFPRDGDYASEINPAAEALVEDVGRRLAGGAALFIDYGFPAAEYYHPQRSEGTLMCHYRHRAHDDPFAWPGLTDITAHVDFTAMAEAGERAGLARRGLHGAGAVPDRLRHSRRARRDRRAGVARLHSRGGGGAEAARAVRDGRAVQGAGAREVGRDRVAGFRRRRPPAPVVSVSDRDRTTTESPWKRPSPPRASSWVRCPRGTRATGRTTPRSSSRRAAEEHEIRLTWREFDAYLNRCANALASLGVARGDRVATVLPNSLVLLAAYWACAKLGAVVVPLSPLLNATGLASLLADATPPSSSGRATSGRCWTMCATRRQRARRRTWVLHDAAPDDERAGYRALGPLPAGASDADPGVRVEPGDLWTLMYTSGTTGLPKGIQHTHFIRAMYAARLGTWRMAPESVVLHSGSIVFNGAMTTMLPAFMLGATFVLERAFDAEAFIATIERERVTHTMLVPSQIIAILNAKGFDPARLASLEMILSLGAPLHQEYKDRLNALLPRRFYELYGLTEGFVTVLDRDDALRKSGSVGVPPPFYAMRIVGDDGRDLPAGEIGEIVGRGPITMPGYYNRPEQTKQRCATAGSTPAISATSTTTAFSTSSTARRT